MRMGVHRAALAGSLAKADEVWLYIPPDLGWDAAPVLAALQGRAQGRAEVGALARDLAAAARPGDHVLIMSNGGFGGLHEQLLRELRCARSGGPPAR
ncbi:murein peptide ligase, partial [mine drainage metagenome]